MTYSQNEQNNYKEVDNSSIAYPCSGAIRSNGLVSSNNL
ncbi:hypothetical protein RintRC_6724 [Richelia intracellularis]|nr:hypothetical protein RintRC_6724 [Richelia intracellularis]